MIAPETEWSMSPTIRAASLDDADPIASIHVEA